MEERGDARARGSLLKATRRKLEPVRRIEQKAVRRSAVFLANIKLVIVISTILTTVLASVLINALSWVGHVMSPLARSGIFIGANLALMMAGLLLLLSTLATAITITDPKDRPFHLLRGRAHAVASLRELLTPYARRTTPLDLTLDQLCGFLLVLKSTSIILYGLGGLRRRHRRRVLPLHLEYEHQVGRRLLRHLLALVHPGRLLGLAPALDPPLPKQPQQGERDRRRRRRLPGSHGAPPGDERRGQSGDERERGQQRCSRHLRAPSPRKPALPRLPEPFAPRGAVDLEPSREGRRAARAALRSGRGARPKGGVDRSSY